MMIVLSYDVKTSDSTGAKRLRKVAKLCESYGVRVQNSVFELNIDAGQLVIMKSKLSKIIENDNDSIRIYKLGNHWKNKIEFLGKKPVFEQDGPIML